ncbi:MAG: NTP transferase domain-containing protein [Phycisphaeraceae bacterium]|nr:NTP transferase domain-containing protein [Phycisphaeraceae bacterium]
MNTPRRTMAVLLAAGKGKRMGREDLPKVLIEAAGRPLIDWVLDACAEAGCEQTVVVIGHQGDRVREALSGRQNIRFVEQAEQLGTGHAVAQAREALGPLEDLDLLVLCGDGPLIQGRTLKQLLEHHRASGAAATLATARLEDPSTYGRIVRDEAGRFQRIVEEKDATESQRKIREVNPSYYAFEAEAMFRALDRVHNRNASGEYYLTDVFALMLAEGRKVEPVDTVPADEVQSINTPEHLAVVDQILRRRRGAEVGP